MRTVEVIVVPYDPKWKTDFEKIKAEIKNALGSLIVGVEHVGSTAVAGLSAKPIIDIDVVIRNESMLNEAVSKLEAIGYVHEGDLGIKGREAFSYSDKPHLQQHHLYVCSLASKELFRHITFRDYLRNNPDAVSKYSKVKEAAAKLYPNEIDKYMEYKSACIEELYSLCGLK